MKNAMAMLLVSQGVPMILMGDEVGQSKLGNNNTYCLDTEINWLDWSLRRNQQRLLSVRQEHDRVPPGASGSSEPGLLASRRPCAATATATFRGTARGPGSRTGAAG